MITTIKNRAASLLQVKSLINNYDNLMGIQQQITDIISCILTMLLDNIVNSNRIGNTAIIAENMIKL